MSNYQKASEILDATLRLNAAAPCLLESVKRINLLASPGHRNLDQMCRDMDAICDEARWAIAQVEAEKRRAIVEAQDVFDGDQS